MAATDRIYEALTKFLASEQPGVFAMKGPWGVGKTYFWRNFIKDAKAAVNCRAYSYVSLFGIVSVAELRRTIFTRQIPLGGTANSAVSKTLTSMNAALRGIKAGIKWGGVGIEQTPAWADMIEDKALNHFLVCIDDLERKEENLSASALLGFIASLRDERGCKVVLLYNDDEILKNSKMSEALAAYREKVVDRELTYRPTVADSYRLAFRDTYQLPVQKDSPANPFHPSEKRSLLEIFESAKTANIRIMRKAKDMLDYCEPEMAAKYRNLWPSFARQVVKVSCLHYLHGRYFDVENVTDDKAWTQILMHRRDGDKKDAMKKYDVVGDVGYFHMGCDVLILEFLKLGYIDWLIHGKLLADQEKEHAMSHLGMELRIVWDLIWQNFESDQATFCREMNAFIAKHGDKMNMGELSQAVGILQEFAGSTPEAEALLAGKVDDYVKRAGEDALTQLNYGGVAQVAVRMIRERVDGLAVKKTLPEVIELMSKPGGWDPSVLKYLKDCTADEYYEFIKAAKQKEFLYSLKTFHERIGGLEDPAKTVRERFEQALDRLARDSKDGKINARRVRYGVGFRIPGITPE